MSKRGRPATDNPKVWFNVGIRTDLCRHIDQLATDAGITRTRLIELVLEKRYREHVQQQWQAWLADGDGRIAALD